MPLRFLRFAGPVCAMVVACTGCFVFGYRAGYLEALHESYFQPAVVIRSESAEQAAVARYDRPAGSEVRRQ